MADGDVDATLEVWPSGHADDYAQFIEEAGTVVDGGLLGITGNIGWFVPSYVVDEYPEYATCGGLQGRRRRLRDRGHRRQGPVPRRRHDLLDLRRADHRGARPRPRGHLQRQRGRVALGARHGGPERGADPDVLVDAAVGEREVRPRRGRAARVRRSSARTSRSTTRRPSATTATTPTTSCTRRSAPSSRRRIPRRSSSCRTSSGRQEDQNGVALAIQEGAEPEEAAQEWVDANQDVWQAWLPAA